MAGIFVNGQNIATGKSSESGAAGRNVGDIFISTRTDTVPGAFKCDGTQYKISDMNGGINNVEALLTSGKLPSVPFLKFAELVDKNGWCGVFGYGGEPEPIITYFYSFTLYWAKSETPESGDRLYNSEGNPTDYTVQSFSVDTGIVAIQDGTEGTAGPLARNQSADFTTQFIPTIDYDKFYVPRINNENQIGLIPSSEGGNNNLGRILIKSKAPTEEDPSWYNIYDDGWCEQGGMVTGNTNITVNLSIPYINTQYYVGETYEEVTNTTTTQLTWMSINSKTTESFIINNASSSNFTRRWSTKGYVAKDNYLSEIYSKANILVQLFNGVTDEALATCTEVLTTLNNSLLPVGTILPYAGTTLPDGYLWCQGAEVSRSTYSALFARIGTAYGEGDGKSTFNLPDLVNRFIEGFVEGYIEAGLPNITGSTSNWYLKSDRKTITNSGAITTEYHNESYAGTSSQSSTILTGLSINASKSSPIYGKSNTVQPNSLGLTFIIKY